MRLATEGIMFCIPAICLIQRISSICWTHLAIGLTNPIPDWSARYTLHSSCITRNYLLHFHCPASSIKFRPSCI
ncbi:hypothetical protein LINPERHAP1_LOCUS35886 [Linum perenne]